MNNKKTFQYTILAAAVIFTLSACKHSGNKVTENTQGQDKSTVVDSLYSSVFLTKANTSKVIESCGTVGGVELESGFDLNNNKTLDSDEIDQTHIICNGKKGDKGDSATGASTGSNPLVVSKVPATLEECLTGGVTLTIGDEVIPLCNAQTNANATDFTAVKSMMTGFKVWAKNLEEIPNKAAPAVENMDMAMMMQSDGIAELFTSIGGLMTAVTAVDALPDGSYGIANYIISPEFASVQGSIKRVGNTLTVTGAVFTSMMSGLEVTIDVDSIILPDAESDTFNAEINGLTAESTEASISPVSASVNVTSPVAFNRLLMTEMFPELNIQFAFGSESAPFLLTTTAAEPVKFEGFMEVDLVIYPLGSEDRMNLKQMRSEGNLSQGGISIDGSSAFVMSNADTYRVTSPQAYSDFLAADMSTSVTAEDVSAEYSEFTLTDVDYFSQYDSAIYELSSLTATRFTYADSEAISERDLIKFDIIVSATGVFVERRYVSGGVTRTYSDYSYGNSTSFYNYDSSINDVFLESFYNGLINNVVSFNYADFSYSSEANVWTETYTASLSIDFGPSLVLPEIGETLIFPVNIDWSELTLDPDEAAPRFGNTPLYNFSSNLSINGLTDINGEALPEVSIMVSADRTGYSRALGGLNIGLQVDDEEFVGRFPNRNRNVENVFDDVFSSIEKGSFSFSDNSGGLLVFNNTKIADYSWEKSVQSSVKADVYYNGLKYGKIYQDYHGDLIVYYSFDQTEELLIPAL